jgi:hypothetical protein
VYVLLWAEQHALFGFPCIAARKALVPAAQRVFVHATLFLCCAVRKFISGFSRIDCCRRIEYRVQIDKVIAC